MNVVETLISVAMIFFQILFFFRFYENECEQFFNFFYILFKFFLEALEKFFTFF